MTHEERSIAKRMATCAAAMIALVAWGVVGAWIAGRVATDRTPWSQWLWWIPTLGVLGVCTIGFVCALRPARRPAARHRRLGVWSVVFIGVLAYFAFVEHRFGADDATDQTGLRIVHWNLGYPVGAGSVDRHSRAVDRLEGDVIILTWAGNIPWLREGRSAYGIGAYSILTDLPVTRGRTLLSDDNIWVTIVEIDAEQSLGEPLILYLVDWPSDPAISRMAVAERVRAELALIKVPPPDVIVGDFNAPRGSASIGRAFPGFVHAFEQAGHGYAATFPRQVPIVHIDHILLGDGLRAVDYDIIDPGIGRHRAHAATIVTTERFDSVDG